MISYRNVLESRQVQVADAFHFFRCKNGSIEEFPLSFRCEIGFADEIKG
jgi:hypothetical protein